MSSSPEPGPVALVPSTSWFPSLGRSGRPLRIGYGRIFHEACADSPVPTTPAAFHRMHHLAGAELAAACGLRGSELKSFFPHAELTGFQLAARLAGDVDAVPLVSSLAVPGGPLTRDCFAWLVDGLVAAIQAAGPLDGVYLALHGSMEVEGLQGAPEAVILRAVREALGPGPRIAASFDLHGNLTSEIVDALDILVAFRTNPHWDLAPTGFRSATRLIRLLRDQVRPVHAWRKLPVVLGGGITINQVAPMRQVFARMKAMERLPRVLTASLFMVHPYTSSTDLGWAVHITTDGDSALADRLADELADLAWTASHTPIPEFVSVETALQRARDSRWRRLGPVTLVDTDDIVGAGAPGGNTRVLQALLASDSTLSALIPIHDPDLYAQLAAEAIGSEHDVVVRGTPGYGQPEVPLRVRIAARSDDELGKRVLLDAGRIQLAIAVDPPLPIHPRYWTALGVRPRSIDLMVQKNFFHYRIFHLFLSFLHIPIVTQGATNMQKVTQRALRVPSRPQVALDDWRDGDRLLRT
jgi:microcystin degradation protein MlrC